MEKKNDRLLDCHFVCRKADYVNRKYNFSLHNGKFYTETPVRIPFKIGNHIPDSMRFHTD